MSIRTSSVPSRRLLGSVGAAVALTAIASQAWAQQAPSSASDAGPHGGGHRGMMGHGGMGHGMRPSMMQDPAMQERMLERRTSHMLDAVEATPEQRSKIMGIAKGAFKDMAPMREQQKASREKGRAMMFAATIDRAGLEKLRQDQLKLRDAMGQRRLNSMIDALSALTPEQRAKLGARKPGMGRMGGAGMMR
jgi:Spy/CpxP family protein refolding chaperone